MNKFPGIKPAIADKQSVRTTFKLPQETIDYLKHQAKQHNVTIKELFDSMCSSSFIEMWEAVRNSKKSKDRSPKLKLCPTIRKTYVISKKTFNLLTKTSQEHKIPRDMLVEGLIDVAKSAIDYFNEKSEESKNNYPKALLIIEELSKYMDKTKDKLKNLIFVNDDPILERLILIEEAIDYLATAIGTEIHGGEQVDPYDIYQC